MTRWRWVAFGTPGVWHVDTPWSPTKPGGETRHMPLCGLEQPKAVAVEPDGSFRCVECLRRLMGG